MLKYHLKMKLRTVHELMLVAALVLILGGCAMLSPMDEASARTNILRSMVSAEADYSVKGLPFSINVYGVERNKGQAVLITEAIMGPFENLGDAAISLAMLAYGPIQWFSGIGIGAAIPTLADADRSRASITGFIPAGASVIFGKVESARPKLEKEQEPGKVSIESITIQSEGGPISIEAKIGPEAIPSGTTY